MEKFLTIAWEILKVAVIPVCIWYFETRLQSQDNERRKIYEAQQKKNTDIQFLMMERIDSLSDMTQMMARKLHDAGIINGDLEEMHRKYEGLNTEYERNIKTLALKVLNK
jgi:hypothetical protein